MGLAGDAFKPVSGVLINALRPDRDGRSQLNRVAQAGGSL